MHLRSPSVDRGVQSFIWAVVFFLVLYLGMVAIEVSKATALVLSLVVAFLVFLLVRTRGELMKRAGELNPGGMAAILGVDIPTLDKVCAEASTTDDRRGHSSCRSQPGCNRSSPARSASPRPRRRMRGIASGVLQLWLDTMPE